MGPPKSHHATLTEEGEFRLLSHAAQRGMGVQPQCWGAQQELAHGDLSHLGEAGRSTTPQLGHHATYCTSHSYKSLNPALEFLNLVLSPQSGFHIIPCCYCIAYFLIDSFLYCMTLYWVIWPLKQNFDDRDRKIFCFIIRYHVVLYPQWFHPKWLLGVYLT